MKHLITLSLLFVLLLGGRAIGATRTELYSAAYGKPTDPAVIFLHGGPGYNSFGFENSTAQKLADAGYYVIVYDQRGSGRSQADTSAKDYTFTTYCNDLLDIYTQYHVSKSILMGHSWGGAVAIHFAEKYPEKVSQLVLVSAPLDYQATLKTILVHCRKVLTDMKSPSLKYIDMLDAMDTTSLEYSSYTFMNAMICGLYSPKVSTPEARALYSQIKASPSAKYASDMGKDAPTGFYKNEKYTLLRMYTDATQLKSKIPVAGIYGNEDGLFDTRQLDRIKQVTGADNFVLLDGASHNVFIDQQAAFISAFQKLTNNKNRKP